MPRLFTIVIPMYNEEKDIINCLSSIISQDVECNVIIVDNNSTDNSHNMVKEFIRNKKNLRLLKCREKGVSFARNKGWKNSQTKYIFFLDADETLPIGFLRKLLFLLKKSPEAVSFKVEQRSKRILGKLQKIRLMKPREYHMKLWKKDILEKLNGYNTYLETGEDLDIQERTKQKKYHVLDSNLTIYHRPPETVVEFVHQGVWFGKGLRISSKFNSKQKSFMIAANMFFLSPLFFLFLLYFGMNYYLISICPFIFIELMKSIYILTKTKDWVSFFIPLYDTTRAFFFLYGLVFKK